MRFLHTSDWHLGRTLYGKKRYEEFSEFLRWLVETVKEQRIDALLVAGDVFDTTTPSNRAQELYYQFLRNIQNSNCRHIVIIAGNHDSPSFLNAPRELLKPLNVHLVGSITDRPEDEVITLETGGRPKAVVCAVPYLRDRDLRTAEPGETADEKNAKLVEGIRKHYAEVAALAEQRRAEFERAGHPEIPVVGMGHLFTSGAKTVDGDGVRELYVGSLAHIGEEFFPDSIDYLALGHLHVPQAVPSRKQIRYSGSPIPIGYGEAEQKKQVLAVTFRGRQAEIGEIEVPRFQQLVRLAGPLGEIRSRIDELKRQDSRAWLEIEYTGSELTGNLRQICEDAVAGSNLEIRRIKNRRIAEQLMSPSRIGETLDDLNPDQVFRRRLEAAEVPEPERPALTEAYREIVQSIHETDRNAE